MVHLSHKPDSISQKSYKRAIFKYYTISINTAACESDLPFFGHFRRIFVPRSRRWFLIFINWSEMHFSGRSVGILDTPNAVWCYFLFHFSTFFPSSTKRIVYTSKYTSEPPYFLESEQRCATVFSNFKIGIISVSSKNLDN